MTKRRSHAIARLSPSRDEFAGGGKREPENMAPSPRILLATSENPGEKIREGGRGPFSRALKGGEGTRETAGSPRLGGENS